MDRRSSLTSLAARLRAAFATSNWRELKRTDAELAQLLRKLPTWQKWTQAERSALTDLELAHAEARQHCARESALYAERMANMRQNRDAWMAYASQNDGVAERP
jgi:hypothetical protein